MKDTTQKQIAVVKTMVHIGNHIWTYVHISASSLPAPQHDRREQACAPLVENARKITSILELKTENNFIFSELKHNDPG
jgi:hypothetical protein